MGTQTMGSHASGFGNSGGEPKSGALSRQGSLYNLTLDEVQNQLGDLGKPLSSMNLDELLKSVWSVETNQGMSGIEYGSVTERHVSSVGQIASASSLSQDLSKKTVDELWQDIKQGSKKSVDRQSTLGEMTLEDFLVKAGVVSESAKKNPGPDMDTVMNLPPQQQQPHWMHYQIPSVQPQPPPQQQNMLNVYMPPGHQSIPIMDASAGYTDGQITMSPSPVMGALSDTQQTPGRKRGEPEDVVEKTVERRQKRMIKNRESAARSRARKQAYTHELEHKVERLEQENERLKRQKMQEVEKVLPWIPPPERKYQLRRTSSASF
jgi:ABA responsive element binding factor